MLRAFSPAPFLPTLGVLCVFFYFLISNKKQSGFFFHQVSFVCNERKKKISIVNPPGGLHPAGPVAQKQLYETEL